MDSEGATIPENRADPELDRRFMGLALAEARRAFDAGEVPVGCVIVGEGRVIGRAHNQRELLRDPTAHAEMIAITQAAEALAAWRLSDTVLYVTLEPCVMCAGAIVLARIPRVVYGATDPKAGGCGSVLDVLGEARLNHRPAVTAGVEAQACGALLREFFGRLRGKGGA